MFGSNKNEFFTDLPNEVKQESKYMSKFFVGFVLSYVVVYLLLSVSLSFLPALSVSQKTSKLLSDIISQFMMPLMFVFISLFTRGLKAFTLPATDNMSVIKFLKILAAAVFVLAVGSMIAGYAVDFVSFLKGTPPQNYVSQSVQKMSLTQIIIYVVLLAPVFEELVFRKLLIDKLAKYGTTFCVFVSAFIFGLIHANLYQFFYAFGLGVLLGYVYCIYGKLLYPILIHMFINTLGSVVPIMLNISETANVTTAQKIYIVAYLAMVLCGGIITLKNHKKLNLYKTEGTLMFPAKSLFKSWGFAVCVILLLTEFIYNTLA